MPPLKKIKELLGNRYYHTITLPWECGVVLMGVGLLQWEGQNVEYPSRPGNGPDRITKSNTLNQEKRTNIIRSESKEKMMKNIKTQQFDASSHGIVFIRLVVFDHFISITTE